MKNLIKKIKENKKLKNAVISTLSITLAFALFGSGFAVYRNSKQNIEVEKAENQNTLKDNSEKVETNGNDETENFGDGENFSKLSESEEKSEADTTTAPDVKNSVAPTQANSVNGNGNQSSVKTQNNKPATQPSKNNGATTTKPNTPVTPPATESATNVHYATVGDEKAIADRVIYYINEFRKQEGTKPATKLPGKTTQLAEYRSRQLVTNFSHDTDDVRAATAELKYGKYIDPELYGMACEPYYEAPGGDACGKISYSLETIDEIAYRMANGFRNSKGHWRYVGAVGEYDKNNNYIAVGITIANGYVFCDVWVTDNPQYD